jgi:hypothetical protein
MLEIRWDHIHALSSQQSFGFAGRMIRHLREIYPGETNRLDDTNLRVFVERVCDQAEKWDITDEPHVERLIELFAVFESLRCNPLPEWITEVVTYPGRPGEQILCRLEERLLFGDRA